MSLHNPIVSQLYQLEEEEANRWKALFDDKFSDKDIRMILLIYFYLKLSGLYSHEDNLFIISIQKYVLLTHQMKQPIQNDGNNKGIQQFYKKCESISPSPSTDSKIEKNIMVQFITDTLQDNERILNYVLGVVKDLLQVYAQQQSGVQTKLLVHHNIVERNETELDVKSIVEGVETILIQSKHYIQKILKSTEKDLVQTYQRFRDDYTSTTKDFIQDILLTTTHKHLTLGTLLNIIRHSIYNFLFDFELIMHKNKYYKQVSLHTRVRTMLRNMGVIFTIMPFTISLHFHNKETSAVSSITLLVEDIVQITHYTQSDATPQEFMTTFMKTLPTADSTMLVELFCELYLYVYNGVINSIEYEKSVYDTSSFTLHSTHTSVENVRNELQVYLCSLNPAELLLSISSNDEDVHEHMKVLFIKKDITDAILSNPTIVVCKCNLVSDHNIVIEDVLYFSLGMCNQKSSGVVYHVGEIDAATLSLNLKETTELKKRLEVGSEEETYIHVDTDRTQDIEQSYVFYIECSKVSDIERIRQQLQSKPNLIQQLSTDITSFIIY